MAQTYPLDSVIRVTTKNEATQVSNQAKIVIIDIDTGKIQAKPSFWSMGQELRYYIISPYNTAESTTFTVQIRDFTSQNSINLLVNYELSCLDNSQKNAEKIVKAIYEGDHPEQVLNEKIKSWIKSCAKEVGNDIFINSFYTLNRLGQLQGQINEQAEQIGFSINVNVRLENEEFLKSFLVQSQPDYFPVKVQDYPKALSLRFNAQLDIDETEKIQALLGLPHLHQFSKIIQEEISQYILAEITLHEFASELNGRIKEELIKRINISLTQNKLGRKIAFLDLFAIRSELPSPNETPPIGINISCQIKSFPRPILVKNTLVLNLEDLALYLKAGRPDLEVWAEQKLDKIIKDIFFKRTYTEILLDLKRDEIAIKNKVEAEAQAIGYSIEQLLVIPNLKELELKDRFIIDQDNLFMTSDSDISVKLKTVVTGRIDDLSKIRKYLDPDIDVKERIQGCVKEIMYYTILTISPQQMIMGFYNDKIGEETIEDHIRKKLKNALEEFHISDLQISFKPLETSMKTRLNKLKKGHHSFSMKVLSFVGGGKQEPVKFVGRYQITGVNENGWNTFQSNQESIPDDKAYPDTLIQKEIKDLNEVLTEQIKKDLETQNASYLTYKHKDGIDEIQKGIVQKSAQQVADVFGLNIHIILFKREATTSELEFNNFLENEIKNKVKLMADITQKSREQLLDDLDKLHKERSRLLTNPGPQLDDINASIKEVKKELESIVMGTNRLLENGQPSSKNSNNDESPSDFNE